MAHIRTQTRAVIAQRNLPFVDFYTPLANHPEYWVNDGCHPPAQGAAADTMANVLYRGLTAPTPVSVVYRSTTRPSGLVVVNNRAVVSVPNNVGWTLVISALDGKELFQCSGTGSVERSLVGENAARAGAHIARLRTSSGVQTSALIEANPR